MTRPPTGGRPAGFPDPSERPPAPPGGHPGAQAWGQHPVPPPPPAGPGAWVLPPGPQPTHPAPSLYGAPQHGQPGLPSGWGPPPGYGPPPGPGRGSNTLLHWLVGGAVLLLAGIGTLVAVLLIRDDDPQPAALRATETTATAEAPAPTSTRPPRATEGDLPGGARVPEPVAADAGRYAGSGETALAWVDAMGRQDFQSAYDLSCGALRDAAVTAAAGGDPAFTLGDYFYADTLGGQTFTSSTFDGVEYQADSDMDLASFTLELADGSSFLLLVYVDPDGTVCDFY